MTVESDLGMLFIKELGCIVKIYRDSKGLYVKLPSEHGRKAYLEAKETEK